MNYDVVIGLELHIETITKTKMFSGASTNLNVPPNSNVSVIDMAYPGTMPAVNKKAVENGIMMASALHMEIDRELHFDHKNYFYSDLPRGYQITQDKRPIGKNGYVDIVTSRGNKRINLERIHLEEDTARQFHVGENSYIDYNRAGLPLIEVVTRPDFTNAEEAMVFVEQVREIVTFLGVSDGKMEEGSLRCDVNISLKLEGATQFGTKVEVKNMNSISNIGKAIEAEIIRQKELLDAGKKVISETRRFDETGKDTVRMRLKEGGADYKYFPEANIYPITLEEEFIDSVIKRMPELPNDKRLRYSSEFGLGLREINILLLSKELTSYFEAALAHTKNYKLLVNWVVGELSEYLNKAGINAAQLVLEPANFASLINLIESGKISNSQARQLFAVIVLDNSDAAKTAEKLNLVQVSNEDFILEIINEVINENESAIIDIKNGKDRALGFLVGQVMKKSKGKVNPALADKLMREAIAKR